MNRFAFLASAAIAATLVSGATGATIATYDFETNQSGSFTTAISSADTEANYNYDYATWTPTAPTAGIAAIPVAPSAAGTKGLKMRANFDVTGTDEGVTAFVNAATGMASWVLKFDCFMMWNGPADVSAVGTTTGFTVGNATTARPFHTAPTDFNGWFLLMTGEGGMGVSGDARYYSASGAAPVLAAATPNWAINGGTALPIDMPGTAGLWDAIFTSPSYPDAGLPGRQWVTWELTANNGTVSVSVTPVGGTKTKIASWTQAANKTPGFGFFDLNTGSVAVPPEDNFVIIDNVVLSTAPTAAENWQLLQ